MITVLGWIIAILLVLAFVGKRLRKARAGIDYVKARYWEERNR